ncbi:DUF3942 family protein [Bacillus sp. TK-2]|nr:DUF3942 family protein [Bacillus sp. TK-2]
MNKLDHFIERTKAYVVTDVEERLLREKYKHVVIPCMNKIEEGLKSVDGYDYHINVGELISKLRIHDKTLIIKIDSVKNCIQVNIDSKEEYSTKDTIVLKEGDLYSTNRGEAFTEDILVEYLNETFESIIGQ